MILTEITDVHDPALRDYTQLTDVALRKLLEPTEGLYLAESLKVIMRALESGHKPRSVLTTPEWIPALTPMLNVYPELPVFVGSADVLHGLTGFHMHRGAIAAMHRPELPPLAAVLENAQTVVILENLMDHTNVGAVFRSVAALGADAVLVSESCADPLYRRAVRVSMGAVLQVPWTRVNDWNDAVSELHTHGFEIAALALADSAEPLREFSQRVRMAQTKTALLFGSEGEGLSRRALATADTTVTIPMHHGVNSLNVANAAGIALWAVCGQ